MKSHANVSSSLSQLESSYPRRKFLTGAASLACAPFLAGLTRKAGAAEPIVLVTWGGTYRAAIEDTLCKGFTEQTGIPVTVVDGPDLAKVKAQVMSGHVEWDLFDGTGPQITAGEAANLWEPLTAQIAQPDDLIVKPRASSAAFMFSVGGVGYVPGRQPEPKTPRTWPELWNSQGYPGRVGLRTRASEMLEIALLGDGVPPEKLYPLDVDRAFRSLDKIKPRVAKWIEQTQQTVSLLTSNECDFTYAYASRVYQTTRAGGNVSTKVDQALILSEYFAVPRGSRRKEAAMKFISYVMEPKSQAAFCSRMGNMPVRRSASALLAENVRPLQADMKKSVIVDDSYWATNFERLDRRFKEWLAGD